MATIKDIADRLNISISTVSKGLNGAPDISDALRRSIIDTAVELGYKNSRTQKRGTRQMAVLIENMAYQAKGDFGYDILKGFETAALRLHWGVKVLPVTPELQQKEKYEHFLLTHKCSGACLLGFSLEDPWMETLRTTTIPTSLLDNFIPVNPHVTCIGTDSEEGIDSAIAHLIALRHEKIAFLDGSPGSMISDQRMLAYLSSMLARHLTVDPNFAIYSYFTPDAASYHVPGLVARGVTAILCGSDLIASGVIKCCRELGYSVPEDISVIGFDDLPLAEHLDPPLTTIRQDRFELGKAGFFALHTLTEHVPLSRTMLRPELILRSSTAIARPRLAEPAEIDRDSVLYRNPQLYARLSR